MMQHGNFRRAAAGIELEWQWPTILTLGKGYNWVNVILVRFEAEYDKITGLLEIAIGLLGVCFYLRLLIGQSDKWPAVEREARLIQTGDFEPTFFPLEQIQRDLQARFGKDIQIEVAEKNEALP